MNKKKSLFIFFILILFVVFNFLIFSLIKNKEISFTTSDQKIVDNLKIKLDSSVLDYTSFYSLKHELSSWAGHSGATAYKEESNISIKVSQGKILNYTLVHTRTGDNSQNQDYSQNYFPSKNKLCKEELVSEAKCTPLNLTPPTFGSILKGCRLDLYPDGFGKCKCNGDSVPIGLDSHFACLEDKETNNISLRSGWAFYSPETKESFCYFETKDWNTDSLWAFECNNQSNLELTPLISGNQEELTNVKCIQYADNCHCSFNPIKKLSCLEENLTDFDSEIKKEILTYLNESTFRSINETLNENEDCYSFFQDNLTNLFCFDNNSLITKAVWGRNLNEKEFTSINIKVLNRI